MAAAPPRPADWPWLLSLAALVSLRPAEGRLGVATMLTPSSLGPFIGSNEKVLVDFVDQTDPNFAQLSGEMDAAARKIRDLGCKVPFVKVDARQDWALAEKYVPQLKFPQLLWFVHGQPTKYHYAMRKEKDIVDFVLALDRDPIETVQSEEDIHKYDRAIYAQMPKSSPHFKTLEVVAAQHMDTVAVLHREASGENVTFMSERQGEQSMGYDGEFTASSLERWIRNRLTKSEPIPRSPDMYGGSLIAVGHTLEEMVLQPSTPPAERKDVFLMVYASWCGYSRKFMPVWEEFAIRAAKVPHLSVIKMDGSLNGSPLKDQGFRWEAYPKVLFLRAGDSTPVAFEGDRSVKHLAAFANEHGSKVFDLESEVDQSRLDRALRMEDEAEL
ncbi:unnamed protein product [Prorocentrum cordatum]|uniref:Thioredoxin domain-containing protein n=1 Tax=Prorocentrum cordatum TaxID=2364126 RepID=A0ABN9STH6_9DINO|nr:unnamed protein product [Polarella glacialis]|mmetsp:Transcript_124742/g.338854  ORF Transcript_124742/g.338854 Transcript_124742/m.338854 type:complete len:385 (-) Transcript_124742:257-1411(-)